MKIIDERLMSNTKRYKHYFVDEAGDANLFDRKGNVIAGIREGCSRYFILGVLDILQPEDLSISLNDVKRKILDDPYFRKVPSMHPIAKKTACFLHAKDDIPEVRKEVYTALQESDVRFLAVVRDKKRVVEYVRQRNENTLLISLLYQRVV